MISEKIILTNIKDDIYTDNVGLFHSPLFYGDFIYCSLKKNVLFFKNFYNFLKKNIFNNIEYRKWVNDIINNKPKNSPGRYEHGIYSNQMIYAYFINKNCIPYEKIVSQFNCYLIKENVS